MRRGLSTAEIHHRRAGAPHAPAAPPATVPEPTAAEIEAVLTVLAPDMVARYLRATRWEEATGNFLPKQALEPLLATQRDLARQAVLAARTARMTNDPGVHGSEH